MHFGGRDRGVREKRAVVVRPKAWAMTAHRFGYDARMRTSKTFLRVFAFTAIVLSITAAFVAGCVDGATYYQCFDWPQQPDDDPNVCPSTERAAEIKFGDPSFADEFIGEGTLEDGRCCYQVAEPGGGCAMVGW